MQSQARDFWEGEKWGEILITSESCAGAEDFLRVFSGGEATELLARVVEGAGTAGGGTETKPALLHHSHLPPSYLPALDMKGERQDVCLMLRSLG